MNVCVTGVAGAYVELPDWLALTEQVPAAIAVTIPAEKVHTAVVVEVYVTGNPDEAVALKVNGATPNATPSNWRANLIVWVFPRSPQMFCVTDGAAA